MDREGRGRKRIGYAYRQELVESQKIARHGLTRLNAANLPSGLAFVMAS